MVYLEVSIKLPMIFFVFAKICETSKSRDLYLRPISLENLTQSQLDTFAMLLEQMSKSKSLNDLSKQVEKFKKIREELRCAIFEDRKKDAGPIFQKVFNTHNRVIFTDLER